MDKLSKDFQNRKVLDPFEEENWDDNINKFQPPPPINNQPEEDMPPIDSFKIIVGITPNAWGHPGEYLPTISAMVINLVDSQYGDAGWAFDGELSFYYPILNEIEEFDEVSEGAFEYYGDLTIQEIVNILIGFGFIAEAGDLNQPFPIPV